MNKQVCESAWFIILPTIASTIRLKDVGNIGGALERRNIGFSIKNIQLGMYDDMERDKALCNFGGNVIHERNPAYKKKEMKPYANRIQRSNTLPKWDVFIESKIT